MSAHHERDVKFCRAELSADTILCRAIATVPAYVASVLIGRLQMYYGTNRDDARAAALTAMEIAANDRDLAKPRTKA